MSTIALPDITSVTPSVPSLPLGALAVTTSDTNTFAGPVTIYVGGAGIVTCVPANGGAAVAVTVPAGGVVPFRVT